MVLSSACFRPGRIRPPIPRNAWLGTGGAAGVEAGSWKSLPHRVARETVRPARRWLWPWFPGAPRATGWRRVASAAGLSGRGGHAGCARKLGRHPDDAYLHYEEVETLPLLRPLQRPAAG